MKKIKYTSSFWWFVLLLLIWGYHPFLDYVYAVFYKLPGLNFFAPYIIPLIFIVVILLSARYWGRHLDDKSISTFMILEFVAIVYLIIYPSNASYYLEEKAAGFIFLTIPYILIGANLNIFKCERYFYWISIVSLLLQAVYLLLWGGRSDFADSGDVAREDMLFSYQLLPHVLMVIWQTLKKPKYWNIALSLLGVFLHLSLGTRGPVVCLAVFIVFYLFFVKLKTSKSVGIIVTLLSVAVITYLQPIVYMLNMLIMRAGLSTRIFDFMENEAINDQTGRDVIRDRLIRAMDSAPAFGYGLAGDRRLGNGEYAHNLILELIVSFGWIIGTILIVAIFLVVVRAFMNTKNEIEKGFVLLLACLGIVKLMISGSFLDEIYFFMLLGFCCSVICHKYHAPALT